MGVLVEEKVVAGSVSGHSGRQLGHIRRLRVHQLDGLPLQVQLLPRGKGRCEGTVRVRAQAHPPQQEFPEVGSRCQLLSQGSPPPLCYAGPSEEATPEPRPNSAPLNTLLEKEVAPRTMDRSGAKALTSGRQHPWASPSSWLEEPLCLKGGRLDHGGTGWGKGGDQGAAEGVWDRRGFRAEG